MYSDISFKTLFWVLSLRIARHVGFVRQYTHTHIYTHIFTRIQSIFNNRKSTLAKITKTVLSRRWRGWERRGRGRGKKRTKSTRLSDRASGVLVTRLPALRHAEARAALVLMRERLRVADIGVKRSRVILFALLAMLALLSLLRFQGRGRFLLARLLRRGARVRVRARFQMHDRRSILSPGR